MINPQPRNPAPLPVTVPPRAPVGPAPVAPFPMPPAPVTPTIYQPRPSFPATPAQPAEPEHQTVKITPMSTTLLDVILAESRSALQRHDVAKVSGDRRAVSDARRDLERSRDAPLKARTEIDAVGAIAKALRAPGRLGTNSQWLR